MPARGRQIWHYQRPRTKGLVGDAARRRQSRRRGRRRPRLHGHRPRAPHRAQPRDRRAAVGNGDGGLAPELQRAPAPRSSSATSSSPARRAATRACAGSWPRSIRRPARKCGASGRCRARASRARRRGRAKAIDHPGAADVDDRQLRSGARDAVLADGQPRPRSDRRRSAGRQPLFGFGRGARREDRPAQVALPVHAARRVGLRRAGAASRSSTRRGRGSRASCSCRPTATASSTCSIARRASSSSARST